MIPVRNMSLNEVSIAGVSVELIKVSNEVRPVRNIGLNKVSNEGT